VGGEAGAHRFGICFEAVKDENNEASVFEATWSRVTQQLSTPEPDPDQSIRCPDAFAETVPESNLATGGVGPASIAVGDLPLLSRAASGGEADLVTRELLGKGGMGKVELALQRSLRREVAVKSVLERDEGSATRALVQEAVFTGFLEHPNIVPVHALGRDGEGRAILVMKRVEGVPWRKLIRDPSHPCWERLGEDQLRGHVGILIAVCNALEFAHSHGIVHRDIKPENVMVGAFGEVYLLDWGLAMRLDRRPDSLRVVGTPSYMAPEMLDGAAEIDERTDVYLLGASLHEALAGKPRHKGSSLYHVLAAVARSKPVTYAADVPAELGALCNLATDLDPARRPATAAAFREALERYLEHRGSIELADETDRVLATLQEACDAAEPDAERAAGLFAECRFGYRQALRAWPKNAAARDGLDQALTLMIERALDRRDAGLAQQLLGELVDAPTQLGARVTALAEEVKRTTTRLTALERDLDAGVFGLQRALVGTTLAFVASGAVLAAAVLVQRGSLVVTHWHALAAVVGWLVAQGGLTLAFGKKVLATAINRRLAGCVASGALACALNHLVCMQLGMPVLESIALDGVVLTTETLMLGWAIDRRFFWVTPCSAAGTLAVATWPEQALFLTAGGLFVVVAVSSWALRTTLPGGAVQGESSPQDSRLEE
jgi:hypothetical protein